MTSDAPVRRRSRGYTVKGDCAEVRLGLLGPGHLQVANAHENEETTGTRADHASGGEYGDAASWAWASRPEAQG